LSRLVATFYRAGEHPESVYAGDSRVLVDQVHHLIAKRHLRVGDVLVVRQAEDMRARRLGDEVIDLRPIS
jgi:hypothetical protein